MLASNALGSWEWSRAPKPSFLTPSVLGPYACATTLAKFLFWSIFCNVSMKIILSHKIYFCFIFVLWKNLLKSLVVFLKLSGRLQPPLLKQLESRNVFLERLYTYLISLIILWNYVQYFLIPILRCISPRNFSISSTFQTYCHKTI